jgi:hypothetical protein
MTKAGRARQTGRDNCRHAHPRIRQSALTVHPVPNILITPDPPVVPQHNAQNGLDPIETGSGNRIGTGTSRRVGLGVVWDLHPVSVVWHRDRIGEDSRIVRGPCVLKNDGQHTSSQSLDPSRDASLTDT